MKKNAIMGVGLGLLVGCMLAHVVPFPAGDQKMKQQQIFHYKNVQSLQDAIALFPQTTQDIKNRCETARKEAVSFLEKIKACPKEKQTKEIMLRAYDCAYALVVGDGVLFPVKSLYMDQEMQRVAEEESLKMSSFITEQFECNEALYTSFQMYLSGNAQQELFTKEETYFLKKIMRDFTLSGMHLSSEKRSQVVVLKNECAALVLAFESNIDADVTKIFVTKDDLVGVPESFVTQLSCTNDLYELGMDYPTRDMVLRYCQIESTRKAYAQAFNNRAYPKNVKVLKQLQAKRHELATLLGFESYAAYNLFDLMVKSPERAWEFENELQKKIVTKVEQEFLFLTQNLPSGIKLRPDGKLNPWDLPYVTESVKKKHYLIDEQEFAHYFPLQKTLQKLFKIYESFFDLVITEVPVQGLWHKDVKALVVRKASQDTPLGYIFMDLFPREKKYSHACHGTILQGFRASEETIISNVSVLVCNFTKPTKEQESLMRYGEVKTFFHEFGHALHSLLGATSYSALSGTSVERDFVELPSQLLENWIEDPVILKMISEHYITGQPLSDELIERRKKLLDFCRGMGVATQLYYGMLSLSYFGTDWNVDIDDVTKRLCEKNQPFIPYDQETHLYCSFGHLGGYGAAYYGYLWSLVFSDDVFAQIKKEGLLNPEGGKRYEKAIIGKGGSCDANDMLRDYLGRDPLPDAFYKKLGLS